MSRTRLAFVLILLIVGVLAACQPQATPTPTPRPTETTAPTEVPTEATVEVVVPTEEMTEAATEMMATEEMTEAATEMMATEEMTEAAPTEEMTAEATAEMTPEVGDLLAVAQQAGDFSTLLAAVDAAGLSETLQGDGPFTIFAPTDEAFAALLESSGMSADELLASDDLASILQYHVVAGKVTSDELANYRSTDDPDEIIVPTLNGENLTITFADDGTVMINGTATVTLTNVEAANGVIHVIDTVLMPPSMMPTEEPTEEPTMAMTEEMTEVATEEMATEAVVIAPTEAPTEAVTMEVTAEMTPELGSIIEIVEQAGDFTTLIAALDAAGLTETLEGDGSFTVFAPTDEAFATLLTAMEATSADLLDRDDLADILKYHVVEGALLLEDLKELEPDADGMIALPTLDGEATLDISFDEDGTLLINGTVKIVVEDIEASNGVIHVIDAVLLPPSVEVTPEATAES